MHTPGAQVLQSATKREGGSEVLLLRKGGGGGGKSFSHAEGGAQQVLG